MTTQPEAILEANLVKQLAGQGYARVRILDEKELLPNLKDQLEAFNKTQFSGREFEGILNHLSKETVFGKAKTLRDRFQRISFLTHSPSV